MQTGATGVRWLRGLLLASVVVLLEVALMRYAGSPTELLATLGHATAPSADPVAVILAAMAAAAELVGCYLLVTVLLRMAAALPGLAGALARQASDLVTIPWSGAPLTAPSGEPCCCKSPLGPPCLPMPQPTRPPVARRPRLRQPTRPPSTLSHRRPQPPSPPATTGLTTCHKTSRAPKPVPPARPRPIPHWSPCQAGWGASPSAPPPGSHSQPEPAVHVIQHGDTLWAIAEAHLPRDCEPTRSSTGTGGSCMPPTATSSAPTLTSSFLGPGSPCPPTNPRPMTPIGIEQTVRYGTAACLTADRSCGMTPSSGSSPIAVGRVRGSMKTQLSPPSRRSPPSVAAPASGRPRGPRGRRRHPRRPAGPRSTSTALAQRRNLATGNRFTVRGRRPSAGNAAAAATFSTQSAEPPTPPSRSNATRPRASIRRCSGPSTRRAAPAWPRTCVIWTASGAAATTSMGQAPKSATPVLSWTDLPGQLSSWPR